MNTTSPRGPAPQRRTAMLRRIGAIAVAAAAVFGYQRIVNSAEPMRTVPAPTLDETPGASHDETAVLAGGCFWGVQGVFEHVKGVKQVTAGYAGGASETAHYALVGSGLTGHAESVRIVYDPTQVTYGRLLQVFFSVAHDPTELNRQARRRVAVPVGDLPDHRAATRGRDRHIAQLGTAHVFPAPVVTRVEDYKGSTRPRRITRTTSNCTPTRRTSRTTTCRRSPG